LKERLLPDSPWRDVAGMLRSLDYAAQTVLRDFEVEPEAEQQLAYRGREWVRRNREAFLDGYAEATGPLTEADHVLIDAYELDKAIYECRYEARNRPEWLGIPMAALARAGEES
jgi:maltokinase